MTFAASSIHTRTSDGQTAENRVVSAGPRTRGDICLVHLGRCDSSGQRDCQLLEDVPPDHDNSESRDSRLFPLPPSQTKVLLLPLRLLRGTRYTETICHGPVQWSQLLSNVAWANERACVGRLHKKNSWKHTCAP